MVEEMWPEMTESLQKNSWAVPQKVNKEFYAPAIPLLGVCPLFIIGK